MRFSVAKKIALGFGPILLLMAASSVVAYSNGGDGYRAPRMRVESGAPAGSAQNPAKRPMRAKIHAVRVEPTHPRVA
jgi:hypothetical protein